MEIVRAVDKPKAPAPTMITDFGKADISTGIHQKLRLGKSVASSTPLGHQRSAQARAPVPGFDRSSHDTTHSMPQSRTKWAKSCSLLRPAKSFGPLPASKSGSNCNPRTSVVSKANIDDKVKVVEQLLPCEVMRTMRTMRTRSHFAQCSSSKYCQRC